jgi:predicted GNAT family N-acyltransferase
MLSVPNYSIRDRVDELDLQTCSFLLVMSEPESLTAVVRTTATEAWESTETVRSGVAKGFRGVRSKIARQPVKTSEEFVEVDVTEDAEPDLGSPEEQAKKREEFERRLSEYQTKGLHE